MGNIVDPAEKAPVLDGFEDAALHPQIVEAVKVLTQAHEQHAQALRALDAQYLKPLEAAHDGSDEACQRVLVQVAAVRQRF